MTKHNYIPVKKLEEVGNELADIMIDIEIMRAFSEGFDRPEVLNSSGIYTSYLRAYQFFELLHSKTQQLEKQLDDITVILLESGNYETVQEYLPQNEINLPKIKG